MDVAAIVSLQRPAIANNTLLHNTIYIVLLVSVYYSFFQNVCKNVDVHLYHKNYSSELALNGYEARKVNKNKK